MDIPDIVHGNNHESSNNRRNKRGHSGVSNGMGDTAGMDTKPGYTPEEWDAKCAEVHVPKSTLNSLVMNYLVTYGYQQTAMRFSKEAELDPQVEFDSLGHRREIMRLIHEGDIQTAIEKINDVDPELLDTNTGLHFSLLRLQLVELIRQGMGTSKNTVDNVQPAIDFATSNLAKRAPADPQFLHDLEKTMALLCFPPENLVPQLKELMDVKLRKQIAQDVNEALMNLQGLPGEPKLNKLTRLWGYGEKKLQDKVDIEPLTREQLL